MLKIAFTFIHLVVLLLGFSIISLGVLCISTTYSTFGFGNNKLVFYCLLPLGFFLLVTGIFWGTFHEVLKYKSPSRLFIQNVSHRELRINTIDRPDFYPLSYEDSTDPEKQTFPLSVASTPKQQEVIKIPPPLNSESSTEFISETNEWEQPPPYELSVWQPQQQQTAVQDSSPRQESNSHLSTQQNSHKQDPDCHGPSERLAPVRTSETASGVNHLSVKEEKLEED
ncbi:transmembrane protein 252 [Phaenicophaeus curvirostris]|uniref:transmembrane protein 252 n=1 Tax=Phaenicophaeus curvirostris TaxID=33595 RepID=UPI0037F0EFFA